MQGFLFNPPFLKILLISINKPVILTFSTPFLFSLLPNDYTMSLISNRKLQNSSMTF